MNIQPFCALAVLHTAALFSSWEQKWHIHR